MTEELLAKIKELFLIKVVVEGWAVGLLFLFLFLILYIFILLVVWAIFFSILWDPSPSFHLSITSSDHLLDSSVSHPFSVSDLSLVLVCVMMQPR